MKRKIFAALLTLFAAVGMTACGGEKVKTQEVDYHMTFENRTGQDVSKLQIRYAEKADWMEISLEDGTLESGYRIPVAMSGQMPLAEDGWQVEMQFVGAEKAVIWDGVEFADGEVVTFFLDEDGEPESEIGMDDDDLTDDADDNDDDLTDDDDTDDRDDDDNDDDLTDDDSDDLTEE